MTIVDSGPNSIPDDPGFRARPTRLTPSLQRRSRLHRAIARRDRSAKMRVNVRGIYKEGCCDSRYNIGTYDPQHLDYLSTFNIRVTLGRSRERDETKRDGA